MSESANGSRISERQRRRHHDIQEQACRLVIARGFNGFTMDDLADAVGVSRRTLFNDVSDKASAVLGPEPDLSEFEVMASFLHRGPTGDLLPDLVQTILAIVEFTEKTDAEAQQRHRLLDEAMAADPKVFHLVTERFQQMTDVLADGICEREGWPARDLRARALAATFLALIRLAMDQHTAHPDDGSFQDVFLDVLAADTAARAVRRRRPQH